ncbi:MAG: glycoside hydrolase family 97 catalytic domain-containing protein, partial [Caldilineaceae bacterium]
PASYLPIARTLGGPLALLTSPDGTVKAQITVTQPNSRSGLLRFDVSHGARSLVTSGRLGVSATGVDAEGLPMALFAPGTEYVLVGVTERSVREEYTLAIAERSSIPNRFNEVTIALRTKALPERRLHLVVRAYDEGVALRYVIPAQPGVARAIYSGESTQFLFPAGTAAFEQRPLPVRTSASAASPSAPGAVAGGWSEGVYARVPVAQLSPAMPMPLTLDFGGGEYGAIFEAAVDNFARSSLVRVGSPATGVALRLEGASEAALPYATPWRTLMLAPSAGELIERNYLLYNLAAPSPYSAAQVAAFAAMPGTAMRVPPVRIDTLPDNTQIQIFSTQLSKTVVDFAAARGINYIAYDTGWYGPEFGNQSDPTKEYSGELQIGGPEGVAAYANSKGVGVILYVNQTQLDRNIDTILPLYKTWGVKGIKLGFVDGTTQRGIELIHYSVKLAAESGLFVDVHDAYRPSGMSRTYPNLFTQEGVAGAEHALDAGHTTNLPFTRFIIGAADYTLPYYWAGLPTTRGHQLGLAVIFYSPLNFVFWYDSPSQYDASPGADFLASVPTAWD